MTTSQNAQTKTTAAKAYVGAGIAALVAGGGVLLTALDDGVVTAQEGVAIGLAILVSLGGVFGGVYVTSNKPKA